MTDPVFNPNEYLIDLKGKAYLPVAYRLLWLRTEEINAVIETEIVSIANQEAIDKNGQMSSVPHAIFKATVTLPTGASATGHGSESKSDFNDFLEKAETKSIGRALAALGFGTQFAPELDEGHRIVDSPLPPRNAPSGPSPAQPQRPAPRPVQAGVGARLPTQPQINFLKRLLGETNEFLSEEEWEHLTAEQCSAHIDRLKTLRDG